MIQQPIRVLLVDDSAVVRGLLARALETDPEIVVAGTAMHGDAALRWMAKNDVDVAILDVEMPVMDGLTALGEIQARHPSVYVVMASGLTQSGAETTIRALALGAAGCIAKPVSSSTADSIAQMVRELVPLVKALGRSRRVTPESLPPAVAQRLSSPPIATPAARRHFEGTPQVIVIGSSTGGPKALGTVLTGLPKDFPLPILIVQHMPPMFTPMLAKHIMQDTGRPCHEATHGGLIERGHTYVAPGDFHMTIDKRNDRMITLLNQDPAEHYCRPSVNPLFRTAADWYGKTAIGVMLTGMGDDGIEGTRLLVQKRGYMIAQNEATCVVWGMPRAVVKEDLANEVLPLTEIAPALLRICSLEMAHR